jgi:hypothetical protein
LSIFSHAQDNIRPGFVLLNERSDCLRILLQITSRNSNITVIGYLI